MLTFRSVLAGLVLIIPLAISQILAEAFMLLRGIDMNINSLPVAANRCGDRYREEGLYRIAVEALNNALRHAQARCISVSLYFDLEAARLQVADDGIGFDPAAVRNDWRPWDAGDGGARRRDGRDMALG